MQMTVHKNIAYHGRAARVTGYTAQIADMAADGKTPAEAKAALERAIELAARYAHPTIVNLRGLVAFVGMDRGQWYYTGLRRYSEEPDGIQGGPFTAGGFANAEEAAQAALYNAAQQVWDGSESDADALAELLPDTPQTGTRWQHNRASFLDWIAFQLKVKDAVARGLPVQRAIDVAHGMLTLESALATVPA